MRKSKTFSAVSPGDFGKIHLVLHSVAFAPREALEGRFVDTTREAFGIAQDVSAYSLVAIARAALPLMTEGGSIVTMTYYGSEKVVPHYNVMGVAKASLEASVRYLAHDLGPPKYPGERNQRRPHEHPGRTRDPRSGQHAQAPCGTRSLEAERFSPGNWEIRDCTWEAISPPGSPAKCYTWTADTTSWECEEPSFPEAGRGREDPVVLFQIQPDPFRGQRRRCSRTAPSLG